MFYNRKRKLISNKILSEIQNTILTDKEEVIYWTNKKFAKCKAGFKFEKIKGEIGIKIIELDHDFLVEDFNLCKNIIDKQYFVLFDITEEQYQLIDNIANYSSNKVVIFRNWKEVIKFIIQNNSLKYKTYNFFDLLIDVKKLFKENNLENKYLKYDEIKEVNNKEIYQWIKNHKMHLTCIFDWYEDSVIKNCEKYLKNVEEFLIDSKEPKYKMQYYSLPEFYHIFKVIEKRIENKNYRIALITSFDYEQKYKIMIFSDEHKDYTRIDQEILFFNENEKNYFFDINTNQYLNNEMIINRKLYKTIKKNINNLLTTKQNIISLMIYNFYKNKITDDDYDENKILNERELLILKQYEKLLSDNQTIKIDNVLIGEGQISVVDERFCLEFDKNFINVGSQIKAIKDALTVGDAKYNFNILYENLLKLSAVRYIKRSRIKTKYYEEFKKVTFKVNSMEINVERATNKFLINGIFCRIDDVYYVLSKVICYNDLESFNKYVKDVSYIGIEWKKLINDGIRIELENPFYSIFEKTKIKSFSSMYMRFSLSWGITERSKVYLVLNDKKYLIKYKNQFKKYFNLPKRIITMSKLKHELTECLEKIDSNIILEIVENAIQEAKIVQQRGEKLIKETIEDIGAVEQEIDLNGYKKRGYIFKGRQTNTEYFVDKVNLSVYRNDYGKWNRRCIVNNHNKQRIFEDKLANRLINIYNEPVYLQSFLGV